MQPGPAFVKRQVRSSKHDPLVDEVELLQANPNYAHVRYPNGRESTIATKYFAPQSLDSPESGTRKIPPKSGTRKIPSKSSFRTTGGKVDDLSMDQQQNSGINNSIQNEQYPLTERPRSSKDGQSLLRRSTRTRRLVDRLIYT